MVRPAGLEPVTPTMSRWCSNQLSYGRVLNLVIVVNEKCGHYNEILFQNKLKIYRTLLSGKNLNN